MKKRKIRRRNPVARVVRRLRPQVVPSAKGYKRRPKHKGHSDLKSGWPFSFSVSGSGVRKGYSAANLRFWISSMISAAATGMLVPGP
jgi:hypothetical protein